MTSQLYSHPHCSYHHCLHPHCFPLCSSISLYVLQFGVYHVGREGRTRSFWPSRKQGSIGQLTACFLPSSQTCNCASVSFSLWILANTGRWRRSWYSWLSWNGGLCSECLFPTWLGTLLCSCLVRVYVFLRESLELRGNMAHRVRMGTRYNHYLILVPRKRMV